MPKSVSETISTLGKGDSFIEERVCRECECYHEMKTGIFGSQIQPSDISQMMYMNGKGEIKTLESGNASITAYVPLSDSDPKVMEAYRQISQTQAKQRMLSCSGCKSILNQITNGEIKDGNGNYIGRVKIV